MTYPFATLDKGHALQILEQHEQVQRITRRGPEAEMLVEASCPFILGMDSQRADAGVSDDNLVEGSRQTG